MGEDPSEIRGEKLVGILDVGGGWVMLGGTVVVGDPTMGVDSGSIQLYSRERS